MTTHDTFTWIRCTAAAGLVLICTALAPQFADSAELRAQVTEVAPDGQLKLALPAGHAVRPGDLATISGEVPGLGRVTLETRWRIEMVGERIATATAIGKPSGLPKTGFSATITTSTTASPAAPAASASPAAAGTSLLARYRTKAEAGDVDVMLMLGSHYLGHIPLTRERPTKNEEGLRWLRMAAERKNAAAACELATHYRDAKDMATALRWTRQAAEGGDKACMYALGMMLLNGVGVAKDENQAYDWLRKASNAGVSAANFQLAQPYLYGDGVAKDDDKAMQLLLPLARQDFTPAMLYVHALLATKNPAEALQWLRKATEAGDPTAMYMLATAHFSGTLGLPRNQAEARRWYARAAAQGAPMSQYMMAALLDHGIGGEKNSREAARLAIEALRGKALQGTLFLSAWYEWSPAFWREMQTRLKAAGVYQGPINGRFGLPTLRAITTFVQRGS